ncbi:MAG TPA: type II toxin-antitoxin system prevent-host-death family antitoxin [Ilumatobacteraceae bacterium]|nr:type II toxin-antitoxin system prevent-host-death family antitoxin [Ilumatobacteraceae bacterium]HRB02666.1 type II toxin-antitoxin system prevent-host-death family antitoxin [Ilumatobacteraceae bacterium]
MNVGVRELKQHLSEYLDRAAAGEVVQVTERGVPKVQIVPVPGAGAMALGVEQGWLRPALRSDGLTSGRRFVGRRSVADALSEDRGE